MNKQNWFFRIIDEQLADGLYDKLKTTGLKFLVRERGSETGVIHYQGIWYGVEQSLRKYIKSFGYKGNEKYSVKKVDDFEGLVNYLCKGDDEETPPDIRFNEGILTDGRHEVWWIKNKEIKAAKSQSSKKRKIENVLDTCYEDIAEELDHNSFADQIGARILQWYYDEGKRIPTRFAMETMIGTFRLRLNELAPEQEQKSFYQMYYELYGPR